MLDGSLRAPVLKVTNLSATGPGSFATAMAADGPRLIAFEVGGVIDLGGRTLAVRNPGLTISGQTAPVPGITLIRSSRAAGGCPVRPLTGRALEATQGFEARCEWLAKLAAQISTDSALDLTPLRRD